MVFARAEFARIQSNLSMMTGIGSSKLCYCTLVSSVTHVLVAVTGTKLLPEPNIYRDDCN